MTRIPAPALVLGLAGLVPFAWGAATVLAPGLAGLTAGLLPPHLVGATLLQVYGLVILAFMAGVIWGFATRAEGREAGLFFALSVLPPIWALLVASGPTGVALWALLAGFLALLLVDATAARAGLAPGWWMSLRLLLTAGVALCLLVGALA